MHKLHSHWEVLLPKPGRKDRHGLHTGPPAAREDTATGTDTRKAMRDGGIRSGRAKQPHSSQDTISPHTDSQAGDQPQKPLERGKYMGTTLSYATSRHTQHTTRERGTEKSFLVYRPGRILAKKRGFGGRRREAGGVKGGHRMQRKSVWAQHGQREESGAALRSVATFHLALPLYESTEVGGQDNFPTRSPAFPLSR